eukprot:scaffold110392_cov56-Attheya_sp.AAC.4
MSAPYHANATDVPSSAPSIVSHHTPNSHADGTSDDVYSSDISDLERVALFDESVNSILHNNAPSPRAYIPSSGTPSFATHNPNRHAEGTTDGGATS